MVHILQNKQVFDKNKTFFECKSALWEPGPASAWLRVTSACDELAVMSLWGHLSPRRWSDCVNADSRGEEWLSWRSETKQTKKKKKKWWVIVCLFLFFFKFWPDERGRRLRASNQPVLYKYSRKSRSANVG